MDRIEIQAMRDNEDRHWWYRGRRRIVEDEIAKLGIGSDAKVLDAGCGSGRLLDELVVYGDVSGLDIEPGNVAEARARGHVDVHEGVVEDLPWPDETFDLVTCLDVVEHTKDDRVTLRELRRVTRSGGHALITVPAYQTLWSNHDIRNRHYRRYNRRTLGRAASEAGWDIERMTFFNSLLLPPASAVRLFHRLSREPAEEHTSDVGLAPEWMYPALELPMRLEAAWLRRGRRLPAGLSLLAVLKRS
jgi:SAM-dependent methyltransferase